MGTRRKLYLIDAHNLIYKAYFAFAQRPLYTKSGKPTSAVFGFTRMLMKLFATENPEYIGISFDMGGKTHRHDMYPDYKATRPPMPADLVEQIPAIQDIVRAYDIRIVEQEGIEADDILGYLAHEAVKNDFDVFLVTSDKDIFQLVSEHVKVLVTKKGISETVLYDPAKVKEVYGVTPRQIPDYLALVGDSVDNVPGVPGIGPKKAADLLNRFTGLDDIYEHIDEVTSASLKKSLIDNKDQAYLSRELVTLKKDIDIPVEMEDFRVKSIKPERLKSIFQELDFQELMKNLTVETRHEDVDYITIDSLELLREVLNAAAGSKNVCIDLETTSTDPHKADIVGISLSFREKQAYYIPVNHRDPAGILPLKDVLPLLETLFRYPAVRIAGHNIKYDWLVLRKHGIKKLPVWFDTMIAAYLIDPGRRQHNLDNVAAEYLHLKKIPITDLIGTGKSAVTMDAVPVEKVALYACEDADVTMRLTVILDPMLDELELNQLFESVELPLIEVLTDMEETGVRIDTEHLNTLSVQMQGSLDQLQERIYGLADQEFNINSPKQLQFVLFEKLQFPVKGVRKLKTGLSTDETTLQYLASLNHPLSELPGAILEYRNVTKLKSTYVDAIPQLVDPATGRVHTSFNQTVTETGRLSSSEPNLQNIPVRTDQGREIRRAFIPQDENWILLSADYSQVELRILAHMSKDKNMIRAFKDGKDIHTHTAAEVFGVHPELVTSDMRRKAKMINFGIDYGMTEYGLASRLGIGVKEAREYIAQYLGRYSGIRDYIENIKQEARETGYVTTLLNRRRYIPEINDKRRGVREAAERRAINMPVQGTAADMIKIAMIRLHNYFREQNCTTRMIIQVHDELIFEVHKDEQQTIQKEIKHIMENAISMSIPIIVDINTGNNWAEMK